MTKNKKKTKKVVPRKRLTQEPKHKAGHTLRDVPVGHGLDNITKMQSELLDMTDVLLGRKPPPMNFGHLTLMETADAYFARASEMTMIIQRMEREDTVPKGSPLYKFRTGELRTFRELAKAATELGSRRLTKEQLIFEQARLGRESHGND